jgi:hypothetical protein
VSETKRDGALLALIASTRNSRHTRSESVMQALLDALQQELTYQVPDVSQFVRVTLRLVLAALIAGVIGWEREGGGKAAACARTCWCRLVRRSL